MASKAKRGSRWETWAMACVKVLTPARSNLYGSNFYGGRFCTGGIPGRGDMEGNLGSANMHLLCICLFGEVAFCHNRCANQAKLPLGSRTEPTQGSPGNSSGFFPLIPGWGEGSRVAQ